MKIVFRKKPISTSNANNAAVEHWVSKRAYEEFPIYLDFSQVLDLETESIISNTTYCTNKNGGEVSDFCVATTPEENSLQMIVNVSNGSLNFSPYILLCRCITTQSNKFEMKVVINVVDNLVGSDTPVYNDIPDYDDIPIY